MDVAEMAGGGGAIALITAAITRWLSTRSHERRTVLNLALERLGHLEGRTDELARQLSEAQESLTSERIESAARITGLEHRVAELEAENATLRLAR